MKSEKTLDKQTLLPGLLLIFTGIAVSIWREEIIYPAFLVATGIFLLLRESYIFIINKKSPIWENNLLAMSVQLIMCPAKQSETRLK